MVTHTLFDTMQPPKPIIPRICTIDVQPHNGRAQQKVKYHITESKTTRKIKHLEPRVNDEVAAIIQEYRFQRRLFGYLSLGLSALLVVQMIRFLFFKFSRSYE